MGHLPLALPSLAEVRWFCGLQTLGEYTAGMGVVTQWLLALVDAEQWPAGVGVAGQPDARQGPVGVDVLGHEAAAEASPTCECTTQV